MGRKFKEITPDYLKWDELGLIAEGRILRMETSQNDLGDLTICTLQPDDGQPQRFICTKKLQEVLPLLELGTYVKVTYIGDVDTGKGLPMKDFKVEIAVDGD